MNIAPVQPHGNGATAHISPEQRFKGSLKCPICGGSDDDKRGQGSRCYGFLSDDGAYAHCTREDHAGAIPQTRAGTFGHKLRGPCKCGVEHNPAEPTAETTYDYLDADGRLVFQVVRKHSPKGFFQRTPGPGGGWILKGPGAKNLVPYRLPELIASDPSQFVFVCEGEKGTDRVRGLGLVATNSPMGAKKWKDAYKKYFKGRRVVILPDNDDDGRAHADQVFNSLIDVAAEVRVLALDVPPKGDAYDWIARGGTRDELLRLADASEAWTPKSQAEKPGDAQRPTLTDAGNGQRLVSLHGDDFKYVEAWKRFLIWDGRRWSADEQWRITVLCKKTAKAIYREAAECGRDEDPEEIARWAKRSESRDRLEAMAWCSKSEPGVSIGFEKLNPDPWSLSVENGTIDLRTGQLRPHRRGDLITSVAPVAYNPSAECPAFDKFIREIFADDDELIAYVQRLCGMALTGDVSEQILPIFHGSGSNGKSTLLGTMLGMLGKDMAYKAPSNLLVKRRNESHPTELAGLYGKRLVFCVETGEGAQMNEQMVKELTGGDDITARRMREDFWTFAPTHKIILCTNHKPVIPGTDHAIWRRVQLVPFNVKIDKDKCDRFLPAKLTAERSGILSWCVRGCLDWLSNGLNSPDVVTKATEGYRKDEDTLAAFLADHCVENPALSAKSSQLYKRYLKFTEGSGEVPKPQRSFGKSLSERGFERYTNNGTWYRGLGLCSEPTPDADGDGGCPY